MIPAFIFYLEADSTLVDHTWRVFTTHGICYDKHEKHTNVEEIDTAQRMLSSTEYLHVKFAFRLNQTEQTYTRGPCVWTDAATVVNLRYFALFV